MKYVVFVARENVSIVVKNMVDLGVRSFEIKPSFTEIVVEVEKHFVNFIQMIDGVEKIELESQNIQRPKSRIIDESFDLPFMSRPILDGGQILTELQRPKPPIRPHIENKMKIVYITEGATNPQRKI